MASWFPVRSDLLENTAFQGLSPSAKAQFLVLLSEFTTSRSGLHFFRSDAFFAAALGLSLDQVRRNRRALQAEGLIETLPGFRSPGGHAQATRYDEVAYADFPAHGEGSFAKVDRVAFTSVVATLCHSGRAFPEVLVFVALSFWRQRQTWNGGDEWYISKHTLSRLTGLADPMPALAGLQRFRLGGGSGLFAASVEHHRITFREWNQAAENGTLLEKIQTWRMEQARAITEEAAKRKLARPKVPSLGGHP